MKKSLFIAIFVAALLFSCAGPNSLVTNSDFQQHGTTMKVIKLGRNNQEIEVKKREVLTCTDRYAVRIKTEEAGYVYVYNMDSTQNIISLFPNRRYSSKINPLKANESFRVPDNNDQWLTLDENTGREDIILLTSKKPLSAQVCERIVKASRGCDDDGRGRPPCGSGYSDEIKVLKFYFIHR